ncbi:hypothetical protein B0H14DRAFT_3780200, partial [Mycena olivaceomarginata]
STHRVRRAQTRLWAAIRVDVSIREACRRPARQECANVPTPRVEGDGMRDEKELGGQEGRGWVQVGGDKMEGGRGMKVKVSRDVYGREWEGGRESRCRCRSLLTPGVQKREVSLWMRHHARLRLGAGEGDWDTAAEEGETWVLASEASNYPLKHVRWRGLNRALNKNKFCERF